MFKAEFKIENPLMRRIDTVIGAEDFKLVVFRNMHRLPRLSLPHSLQPGFYFDAHTASRAYWYLNLNPIPRCPYSLSNVADLEYSSSAEPIPVEKGTEED